jgi:hypothetical protein
MLPEAWAPQRDTGWAYKFKNLSMKTTSKLKVNPIQEYLGLIIYPIKQSAGLFFLIKSRETIPLSIPYKILKILLPQFLKKVLQY